LYQALNICTAAPGEAKADAPVAPELEGATDWLNTGRPLRLEDLRGKIVLLDFWTFCCINCMHILPDLEYLEDKYRDQLVVIGIHSAKFKAEKDSENIRHAIRRYQIKHPVANDSSFLIWARYGARAWPTLVLIDPEGRIVGALTGEGHRQTLDEAIGKLVDLHRENGTLEESSLEFALDSEAPGAGLLRYPGKVHVDAESQRLFISDTNNNRIVIAALDGRVLDVIGSGAQGLDDGAFESCRLNRPQGTACRGNLLYIADAENHAIRAADLDARTLSTVGGTGAQGTARSTGRAASAVLSTPWDLVVHQDFLYIAMAGTHQIWRAEVQDWSFEVFAGTGKEDLDDGPRLQASLAQPSGLAVYDGMLYIADSEVSAVRRVSLEGDGRVETLVGKGLFDFGDRDGIGAKALLQHPLGVAAADGVVYIADSYNHRVKSIDLETLEVRGISGGGEPGCDDGLHEPGGLTIYGGSVYVADTNNHRVCLLNRADGAMAPLHLHDARKETGEYLVRLPKGDGKLHCALRLPEGHDWTEGAPPEVEPSASGEVEVLSTSWPSNGNISVALRVQGEGEVALNVSANYCSQSAASLCGIFRRSLRARIVPDDASAAETFIAVDLEPLAASEAFSGAEDDIAAALQDALACERSAIEALEHRIGPEAEEAVRLLNQCEGRVVFTGMGKMGLVARKICATFTSLGAPSLFLHPAEAIHGDLGIVAPSDVVLALSYSGETEEIVGLLPHLHGFGVDVIAMTGNPHSTLAQHSRVVLDVSVEREADPLAIAPTASTTAALAMGDALAAALVKLRRFSKDRYAVFHPGGSLGRALLYRVRDLMQKEIPMARPDTVLRDAICEMSGGRRLGAVFIVDDDGRLAGVFTDGDLRRVLERETNPLGSPVGEYMTATPKRTQPEVLAVEALHLMEDSRILVLPVVDDHERPIAALHMHDLIRAGLALWPASRE
jgi:KpsF/GutQ family protein